MDLASKYQKTKTMSPENYASLKNKSVNPYVIIDTSDFENYCIQHGYDNSKFHKDIWIPFMSDFFCNGEAYVRFSKHEKPKNKFQELINAFLDDFPEFEDVVRMMFTN